MGGDIEEGSMSWEMWCESVHERKKTVEKIKDWVDVRVCRPDPI